MWDSIRAQAERVGDRQILDLFDNDNRAEEFSLRAAGMLFDYSKTQLDEQSRAALIALAQNAGVEQRRAEMFSTKPKAARCCTPPCATSTAVR